MAIEMRKTLVWATVAAAIASAVMLAASGVSLPRVDAAARSVTTTPAAPAH